ncbi:hypothetical protein B0H66DRAFT_611191 [Apodospora peruviana]|uniref:Rhodopsin domain-containing protein n=1 Tax=Apodospora peruviana TaxID=516989 RepID=A0AAE0IS70_9PEZI|nr:hypothetical protein B0H66DRAFT_611191 [Apodospora peruviana]
MSNPQGPPMEFPPARNPDDLGRGPVIIGFTWTFTLLAVMAATLRLYVRRKKAPGPSSDDWIMFVAMLFQIANQVLITISYSHGLGKHDVDLQMPDQFVAVLKYNWLAVAPGMVVSILARISITILLLRLFGVHTWFRMFVYVLTSIQVTLGVVLFVCTWIQVKPIEGLWNVFLPGVERWDPRIVLYMMYLGQSSYTFADLAYVILPVAIIWRLNMALHQRVCLILVMSVSILTFALSILKTIWATSGTNDTDDIQYKTSLTVLWSTGEQSCVVLLGCVPPLRSGLSQLKFLNLRNLSLSSIFGSSRGGTWSSMKGSSAEDKSGASGSYGTSRHGHIGASGAYHDVEMNTHKLGRPSDSLHQINGPMVTYDDTCSNKSLVTDGHVRRVDAFTVSYEEPETVGRVHVARH